MAVKDRRELDMVERESRTGPRDGSGVGLPAQTLRVLEELGVHLSEADHRRIGSFNRVGYAPARRSFNGKPKATASARGCHAVAFGLPLNEPPSAHLPNTFPESHMSRTIPVLFALGFLTLTPPSFAQETSSVWQYLGQRATRLAAQLPPLPTSAEDWDKQRTELTSRLSTTLGLPEREPMQATVISCKQTGDLAIEEVAFHWANACTPRAP
jgi:hypothetical protein